MYLLNKLHFAQCRLPRVISLYPRRNRYYSFRKNLQGDLLYYKQTLGHLLLFLRQSWLKSLLNRTSSICSMHLRLFVGSLIYHLASYLRNLHYNTTLLPLQICQGILCTKLRCLHCVCDKCKLFIHFTLYIVCECFYTSRRRFCCWWLGNFGGSSIRGGSFGGGSLSGRNCGGRCIGGSTFGGYLTMLVIRKALFGRRIKPYEHTFTE